MADSKTPTRKVRVSSTTTFGDVTLKAGQVNTVDAPLARHLVASGKAAFADEERSTTKSTDAVETRALPAPGDKK